MAVEPSTSQAAAAKSSVSASESVLTQILALDELKIKTLAAKRVADLTQTLLSQPVKRAKTDALVLKLRAEYHAMMISFPFRSRLLIRAEHLIMYSLVHVPKTSVYYALGVKKRRISDSSQ